MPDYFWIVDGVVAYEQLPKHDVLYVDAVMATGDVYRRYLSPDATKIEIRKLHRATTLLSGAYVAACWSVPIPDDEIPAILKMFLFLTS